MKKHFVTFLSPGTFVSEESTREIESWDIDIATDMARSIKERHGAIPYGFFFTTRERGEKDFDNREAARSSLYYLGGKIETYDEVCARNDPKEEILRFNMKANGYDRIIVNDNSWRFTAGLKAEDTVLPFTIDT